MFIKDIYCYRKYSFRILLHSFTRLGFVLLTSLIVMLTMGRAFVQTVITNKSQLFYTAWQARPLNVFHNMSSYYGWLGLILAAAGLITRDYLSSTKPEKFIPGNIIRWDRFYPMDFCGSAVQPKSYVALHIFFVTRYRHLNILGLDEIKRCLACGRDCHNSYLSWCQCCHWDSSTNIPLSTIYSNSFFRPNCPLQLSNYDQVVDLVHQLHNLSTKRKSMAVIASSGLMNYDLLSAADHALFPSKPLKLIFTPEIDSRDYYPIEVILQAKYLIIIDPIQLHLAPSEQDVLSVVFQIFSDHWEITDQFIRLPETYKLTEGVNAIVYQRTQDIDIDMAIRTLVKIQESVNSRPFHQPDWIRLSGFSSNLVRSNQGKYRLQASSIKEANFLYLGAMPKLGRISGNTLVKDPGCGSVTLNISAITVDGEKIPIDEVKLPIGLEQPFSINFQSQKGNFLLLILTQDNSTGETCLVNVKQLQVTEAASGN